MPNNTSKKKDHSKLRWFLVAGAATALLTVGIASYLIPQYKAKHREIEKIRHTYNMLRTAYNPNAAERLREMEERNRESRKPIFPPLETRPETVLDILPHQMLVAKNGTQLKFGPGWLYHGGTNLDEVILYNYVK